MIAIIKIIILQENKIYSKHTFFKYLFLMIKMVDIILFEGLKEALERGDSLQRAMMSFYNAGYSREAIEEAARELQIQQQRQQIIQQVPYSPQPVKKEIPKPKQQPPTAVPQAIQRVSNYGENKDESIKKIRKGITRAIEDLNRIEFPEGKVTNKIVQTKNVSDYIAKPKRKWIIITLIIILVILLGALGGIFLFRKQVLSFFDNSNFFSGIFG